MVSLNERQHTSVEYLEQPLSDESERDSTDLAASGTYFGGSFAASLCHDVDAEYARSALEDGELCATLGHTLCEWKKSVMSCL